MRGSTIPVRSCCQSQVAAQRARRGRRRMPRQPKDERQRSSNRASWLGWPFRGIRAAAGADLAYLPGGLPSRLGRFTPRAGALVSAAASVGVSGGYGVLAVCESSGPLLLARCAIARARFSMRSHLGGGDIFPAISPAGVHCGARQGELPVSRLMAYRGTAARWPGQATAFGLLGGVETSQHK